MPSTRKRGDTFLEALAKQNNLSLQKAQNSAADAYVELANMLSGKAINGNKLMSDNKKRLVQILQPRHLGRMCMYFYDPKLKDTLPYYDRFPLVIPVNLYDDGFLGLNLHYLPMNRRALLMDALYSRVIKNQHLDERKRIMISWNIVQSAARSRNFLPCVKRYLYSHFRSQIQMIEPEDWNIALFVPTDRWAKANKRRVYQESLDKIRRGY